jgi:hypothetical protein
VQRLCATNAAPVQPIDAPCRRQRTVVLPTIPEYPVFHLHLDDLPSHAAQLRMASELVERLLDELGNEFHFAADDHHILAAGDLEPQLGTDAAAALRRIDELQHLCTVLQRDLDGPIGR